MSFFLGFRLTSCFVRKRRTLGLSKIFESGRMMMSSFQLKFWLARFPGNSSILSTTSSALTYFLTAAGAQKTSLRIYLQGESRCWTKFHQFGRKLEFKLISLFAPKKSNWAAAIKQELSIAVPFMWVYVPEETNIQLFGRTIVFIHFWKARLDSTQ